MEHRIQSSRRSGEQWHLKCSCGWFITSHRYICEEAFQDHATPEPQIEEPRLKWWDDASYIRYQTDCGPCDGNNWWEYTMEDMIALANPPMLLHDEWGHPYWHTPKLLPSPCEATLLRAEADRQDQADTPRERNWKCKGCRHLNGTECKVGSEWRAYHDKNSLTNPSFPNGIDISQHFPCYRKVGS